MLKVEGSLRAHSTIILTRGSFFRKRKTELPTQCWVFVSPLLPSLQFEQILHQSLSLSQICSPLSSFPSVWTLLRPQGALPLRLSLSTPLGQQVLRVLLPPQQHRLQILLQRDWVPDGHAAQPHHHLRRLCTQVSKKQNHCYFTPLHCASALTKYVEKKRPSLLRWSGQLKTSYHLVIIQWSYGKLWVGWACQRGIHMNDRTQTLL